MEDLFTVVTWPESQDLMELEGFEDNAILINDEPFLTEYGAIKDIVNFIK